MKALYLSIRFPGTLWTLNSYLGYFLVLNAYDISNMIESKGSISVRAKSRLCDTMYHVCMILHLRQVLDTEKNIWQRCSLLVLATQSVYGICSKNPFQIIFGAKKISSFFWNSEYFKCIKYHVSVILSQRRDTLYNKVSHRRDTITSVWYFMSMEIYKVSRLHDSITETWYFIHLKYSKFQKN